MKKGRLFGIMILLLILPVTLAAALFAVPNQYSRTYLAALKDKVTALEAARSPRIVVIGGSGAAFDVDCEALEEQFPGYEVIDLGLYAGLGTTVMLEMALPDLRAGDVVVFMPETSAQTLSDFFDPLAMWQAVEGRYSLLMRLSPSRREAMAGAFPRYAARRLRSFLTGSAPDGEGIYARSSFTARGDIVPDGREANRMPGGFDVNAPLSFDASRPSDGFVERVNAFTLACEKVGARVLFRFCPMNAEAFLPGEREKADAFEQSLRDLLRCEVIGNAQRAVMDAGWFFDTNYHLNAAGAVMNTILLAEDLKAALGDPSPVTAELPAMPGAADAEKREGNSADRDMFLYAVDGDGLTVTGLTAEGLLREALTVPADVLTFTSDAFSGADRLRTLTLQDGLRVIPDGAFRDCPALKEIILLQDDPGKCTVGGGLLGGTDALVYVPADRYGSYCTNYFWAAYASRLRPLDDGAEVLPVRTPEFSPAPAVSGFITYHGNGGVLRAGGGDSISKEITNTHLRMNTLRGTAYFTREGHVLTGWNTEPGGKGLAAGLGSRVDPAEVRDLYAQWLPEDLDGAFAWRVTDTYAVITGYFGQGGTCVLPQVHEGLPVRAVDAGAFDGKAFDLIVLSPALRWLMPGAFTGCAFDEMILYDSLETVSDDCFVSCALPRTLRVNAAAAPAYSGSYFDTFQDKYDILLSLKGRRKLVLSSGSSGRYGYDCALLREAFPELEPVNMGVYAYTNALPQLMLILPLTDAGDILLYAPEFDAVKEQFCVTADLDIGFWAMMESCYDTAAGLDMRLFTRVFDSFGEYLTARAKMPTAGYDVSPANYDDDGKYYAFSTYNAYGDFILPRPDGDHDGLLRHNIADYTLGGVTPEAVDSLNEALAPFTDRGIRVFFSYTPRNIDSLTEGSTAQARQRLHEYLVSALTVPVISDIEDYLMPGRYFWLIDSHLSTNGAKKRTERVILDLKKAMEDRQKEERR